MPTNSQVITIIWFKSGQSLVTAFVVPDNDQVIMPGNSQLFARLTWDRQMTRQPPGNSQAMSDYVIRSHDLNHF